MPLPNIFSQDVTNKIIQRINTLQPTTAAQWGKMNVGQMLAHCNVTYEMVYEDKHPKPNFFMGFVIKTFIKKLVTNDVPYKRNSQTAPQFLITTPKEFEAEKTRLINYLTKTQQLGESHFDNNMSHSMGVLNKTEWNNMFYKHLDHHLSQFGV